jgi:hypothetical protein
MQKRPDVIVEAERILRTEAKQVRVERRDGVPSRTSRFIIFGLVSLQAITYSEFARNGIPIEYRPFTNYRVQ